MECEGEVKGQRCEGKGQVGKSLKWEFVVVMEKVHALCFQVIRGKL